ncbi:hypothetical protein PAESOLCIP111_04538 [Paenibacillus solanacearum]|uniref:Cysteine-rich CWC family protein n=1 Tax=Paenibacillus solanacearum TaxID=2048548 RepID=A0A916NK77_9BACL|nr:cysteine-rich CWC family protein [Paenibacillus solanacearum]CAG7643724.1 hypothetical protein PAESOLCIP111_04538 [Paenibacillus solanacearum]
MEAEKARTCPICGGDNDCGNAADRPPGTCWCGSEYFPQAIFALVKPELRGKACICIACVQRFRERHETTS